MYVALNPDRLHYVRLVSRVHNRISTGDRMIKWNQQANSACTFCNTVMETLDHLTFERCVSSDVWHGLFSKLLGSCYSNSWSTIVELVVDRRHDKLPLFLLLYTFQATVHPVWRERNRRRHGETSQTVVQMQSYIDKLVRNRISTMKMMGRKRFDDSMGRWFASR
ncbi:uncharacterized protein LOC130502044 [Raphanus sativus]|uniref:Uncharacterized protein LOC130502044 n=1 Tax=Raphanus sativus TaxID=3726 RepID=A0A9W3CMZ7_RAPSA|nr:uncharacterized protein LOC130502044 [Raphanus sativus]